jgi:hypothetical protein
VNAFLLHVCSTTLKYADFVFAVRRTSFWCIIIVIPQIQKVGGNMGGPEVISRLPMMLPRQPTRTQQPSFAPSSSRGEFCAPSVCCSCWRLSTMLFEFSWWRENFVCKLLLKLMYILIKLVVLLGLCPLGNYIDWGIRKECTEESIWT